MVLNVFCLNRRLRNSVFGGTLAVLIALSSCTSVQRLEDLEPDHRWSYTVRELAGRRSRQRGELSFRGYRLPSYFSEVVIGSRRFIIALASAGDGFEGYREVAGAPSAGAQDILTTLETTSLEPVAGSGDDPAALDPVTPAQRRRGWYRGGYDQKRPLTPDDWIWVRRENLQAWVNPRRIEAFAASHQLAGMHERHEPRFQFMFSYGIQSR